MNYKIFTLPLGEKVMVMETEKGVEFYLQIESSDWHFCVGCGMKFDEVTEEFAESIAIDYFELVDEDECVLERHSDEVIEEIVK